MSESKLIVVAGATGGQGGSVISALLKHAGEYSLRGITRNASSERAKALAAQGVQIAVADLNDEVSVECAFQDAFAIFAVTDFFEPFAKTGGEATAAMEIDYAQGINMVKAASKIPTLQHYIWSTLPNSTVLSQGKVTVPHFDAKARVDDFIRQDKEFLAKTTFAMFGMYAENMLYPIFMPFYMNANKYVQVFPCDPKLSVPSLGDHRTNVGIFTRAILKNPPVGGTYIQCSVEDFDLESYLATWGRASGRAPTPGSTMILQVSFEQYCELYPGGWGEEIGSQMVLFDLLRKNGAPPVKIMSAQELMSEEEKKELVRTEDAMKALDWNVIL